MKTKIGALIISANEPQLERCLHAVYNQTMPFSNVIHMDGIIPEAKAFNQGMEASTDEWVMKINGDMILYSNAVEVASFYMEDDPLIFLYSYGLIDTFLNAPICGCGVFRKSAFEKVPYANMLANDTYAAKRLQRLGMIKRTPYKDGIMIGSHCDNPDEFQVFRRFYSNGVKYGKRFMGRRLRRLLQHTGDPLYDIALKSLMFGMSERNYPTSHNIDFDKEMFEKFKKEVLSGDNNNSVAE